MQARRLDQRKCIMEFGAHLPLILAADDPPPDAAWICDYASAADATKRVRIATTILVPAIRHPFVAAKMLATLDVMSGGRLIVGVGPGSYQPDYEATGVPFEERWKRLDECVIAMRGIWQNDDSPDEAGPYRFPNVNTRPRPVQPGRPPIWVVSWGCPVGPRPFVR